MTETPRLRDLARLYRLQTVYRDGFDRLRQAPVEAILSALHALGAPIESLSDLPNAWRQTRQAVWRRIIEPVLIAWEGKPLIFKLRLPQRLAEAPTHCTVVLETGERIESICIDEMNAQSRSHDIEGELYIVRRLRLPVLLPLGYHRLYLQIADRHVESYLFSSPQHAYVPAETNDKRWGVFCPLYALWSKQSWGAGNFTDLENLVDFVAAQQGHAVATLPMLASYLDEPFNPSPYAPVSRLFDNEFYLDVNRIPELGACRSAQALLQSAEFDNALERARSASLIDYRQEMALKRKVLEELLRFFLKEHSPRRESFEKFVATHPRVQDYASFRATVERKRKGWLDWEPSCRNGVLTANDYDGSAKRYHLYVQWLCAEQTNAVRARASDKRIGLYLDFPLGVNRDGYDVWRERALFVLKASAGAPPDGLFVRGQNWGFPPLHTEALRRQGYRYYIDCLRHHLSLGAMLRIDHVMGLHRAFWVPQGFDATAGLYVHAHAAEFYAILNLESHRHHVQIVGENLGTVPPYVNAAMMRHRILGMHVGLFGSNGNPERALDPVPANTVASIGTHDTATFVGFWRGADIQDRVDLTLLEASRADDEQAYRAKQNEAMIGYLRAEGWLGDDTSELAVLRAWLAYLAGQDEQFLLVNLEDLWLEPAAQNVPGTWHERPNWQRKGRLSLEEIRADSRVGEILKSVHDIRSGIR